MSIRFFILAFLAACSACTRQSPPPAQPPPQEPQVIKADFYVEAEEAPPGQPGVAAASGAEPVPAYRDQSPDIKLLLGHYANEKRGIGAVVDRTQKTAKLRYDGTTEIIKLDPSPGSYGRTDYHKNARSVLMQAWPDGRIVVFLPGAPDGIALTRDADADPL
jgi:hypothetical protein